MLVTLTSDFGTADGYAGAMKGVIVSFAPGARVVDISHDVPAGDVRAGAWCLRVAAPEFPPGTIHVAVVDPGVGGARRPVVVSRGRQMFVGPDNGLLSLVAGTIESAWVIDPGRVARAARIAPTFHGRDIFAPAGARLAAGDDPLGFGESIDPATLAIMPVDLGWIERDGLAVGRVVHEDRFGNLVTSLPAGLEGRASARGGTAGGRPVLAVAPCYEAIANDRAAFVVGSQGLLEISARGSSAARLLGAGIGDEVTLCIAKECG